MKRGDKVKVVYAENGVPKWCYYFGPGVFVKHIKPPHDWGNEPMCVVEIPVHGRCEFPTDCKARSASFACGTEVAAALKE
jgi:hypothetical protein